MARKTVGGVKQRMPLTQTKRAVFSKFDESFTPGWDKKPGAEQAMVRNIPRAKMGRKLTPINRKV